MMRWLKRLTLLLLVGLIVLGAGAWWIYSRVNEPFKGYAGAEQFVDIPQGTEPSLTTRVKMGQSSNVYALVKADGKFHVASKEIKVTLGGCGG